MRSRRLVLRPDGSLWDEGAYLQWRARMDASPTQEGPKMTSSALPTSGKTGVTVDAQPVTGSRSRHTPG